jgi:hypothetical protein
MDLGQGGPAGNALDVAVFHDPIKPQSTRKQQFSF